MPKKTVKLRPAVQAFAEAMELKLREHDHDRGKRVTGFDLSFCHDRLKDEVQELADARLEFDRAITGLTINEALKEIRKETTDVGNFAMMLWHASRRIGEAVAP